jgi:hypothetical protein
MRKSTQNGIHYPLVSSRLVRSAGYPLSTSWHPPYFTSGFGAFLLWALGRLPYLRSVVPPTQRDFDGNHARSNYEENGAMRNHHGRPGPAYLQVEREFVKKMRKKKRKERLAIFFVVVGGVVVATAVAWTALWH